MSKIKKYIVLVTVAVAVGYISYIGYHRRVYTPVVQVGDFTISPYQRERDRQFFFDEFKAHWSLLVMTSEYDIDFMLDNKAPNNREPLFYGKMDIMMLCDNNKPIGFITYYMRTPYQGEILFLDITKAYQGKQLGEKLLNYAFAQLKARGAKVVKLFTRATNFPAQKLYKRVGFVESEPVGDVGFYFRKEL